MTADAESKTPKTDAVIADLKAHLGKSWIGTLDALARQLEADLARKAEEVAELKHDIERATQANSELATEVASLRRERDEAVQLYDEAMALMEPAREASEKALAVLADNAWLQRELQDAREGATRVEAECQKVMRSLELVRDNLRADKEAAEQDAAALREELKAMTNARDAHKEAYKLLRKNMEEALADAKGIQLGELCPNCDCRLPVGCGRTFANEPECLLHKP